MQVIKKLKERTFRVNTGGKKLQTLANKVNWIKYFSGKKQKWERFPTGTKTTLRCILNSQQQKEEMD